MKKVKHVILCIGILAAVSLHAQAQTQPLDRDTELKNTIRSIVSDPALKNAVTGICAMTGDGRTIVEWNAGRALVPASNMKLISTGAAMHMMGCDYRFCTDIAYDGEIIDGVLHGNLHITGGGDPTLASKDSIATDIDEVFALWEAAIKSKGITRIEGHIIGDGRYFEGMAEEPTWQLSDAGTYYGTGTTGLMFYENMLSFMAAPGAAEGDPVSLAQDFPETPWVDVRMKCSTGKPKTGDKLYMYASDLAPVAEIRGTFGVDKAPKRVDFSNKFPEYTCAYHFCKWLEDRGIACSNGAADHKLATEWKDDFFKERDSVVNIATTMSPQLSRIAFSTNHQSNNLYAETLLRQLGKTMTGSACYDSCRVALHNVLKGIGAEVPEGLNLQDGSGLSRQNLVSAEYFCRFLLKMMESPCFEEYVESLPSPGGKGTLHYNMSRYPQETRSRIKAKSGSMNGIRCYSGYIIPGEGTRKETIVFSIMLNNCTSPTWKTRPLLDRAMGALAKYNQTL